MYERHFAITGGIGSGKSFVCDALRQQGFQVYDCDSAARRLMASDPDLQSRLRSLVGSDVYRDGVLQKPVMAAFILSSEAHKHAVDEVVHPAVAADFLASGCQWLESAILFESGFHRRVCFDAVVCVTAPLELRIDRVMRRDGIPRERAGQWIDTQMPQEEMVCRSDYVICNDGVCPVTEQIVRLLSDLGLAPPPHERIHNINHI